MILCQVFCVQYSVFLCQSCIQQVFRVQLYAQSVFVGVIDAHQSAWFVYGRSQSKSYVSHSAAQI